MCLVQESAVAENYDQKFAASNKLSVDQVKKLFEDHARTVQNLRERKGEEQRLISEKLDAIRAGRRLRQAEDGTVEGASASQDGDLDQLNDVRNESGQIFITSQKKGAWKWKCYKLLCPSERIIREQNTFLSLNVNPLTLSLNVSPLTFSV